MKLLQLVENITLNHHQRYILLQIKLASTSTLAFDQINKSEADVQASDMLNQVGFIRVSQEQTTAELTPRGEQAIVDYGLVDETGEVTEVGQQLLSANQN